MFGFVISPLEKVGGAIAIILIAVIGFKVWLAAHDADVLHGYVLQSEEIAAEAQTAEVERQRDAAEQALAAIQKRQVADDLKQQAADAKTQSELQNYEDEKRIAAAGSQCPSSGLLDKSDVNFILQH